MTAKASHLVPISKSDSLSSFEGRDSSFLISFWLKNLVCHLSTYKRESKFISLVLNSLHDLAIKIAPGTSQADGPCTAWGMPIAFHLHGCFTLLPLPGRLCFPLKHHLPYKFRPVSPFLF